MSELLWINSHVEMLLQRVWDQCRVEVDADGDFPFRRGVVCGWVTVTETDPIMVEVYAHAAVGVTRSVTLLSELNEVQRRSVSARVQLLDDTVVVSQVVHPYLLTESVLSQALTEVCTVANDLGPLFAAMFDGRTPYPATVPDQQDATDQG